MRFLILFLLLALTGCQFSTGAPGGVQGGPPGPPPDVPPQAADPGGATNPSIVTGSPTTAVRSPGPPQGVSRRPGTPEDVLFIEARIDLKEEPDRVEDIQTPDGTVHMRVYEDFQVKVEVAGQTFEQPVMLDESGRLSMQIKMPKSYKEYPTAEKITFSRKGYKPMVLENVELPDGMLNLNAVTLEKA